MARAPYSNASPVNTTCPASGCSNMASATRCPEREERDQGADPGDHREGIEGPGQIGQDGLHGHEVEEDFVHPREPVLGLAELAGVVVDLDLGDARPGQRGHGGDEAVHLRIQRDAPDDRRAVGLERAAVVLDGDARDPADHPVGDDGWDLTGHELVLALVAPADHDIEALPDLFQEQGDVARVVLEIAVHGDDDLAAGVLDAGDHGRGLAVVLTEADHPE